VSFTRVWAFIVTNLARPAERIVDFYNQRGTAENWIKEGKGAIKWTRLSCRTFAANAVRLQLHALAYNLGNFMRTLAMPKAVERIDEINHTQQSRCRTQAHARSQNSSATRQAPRARRCQSNRQASYATSQTTRTEARRWLPHSKNRDHCLPDRTQQRSNQRNTHR
jgi:hypothetical protein